MLPDRNDQELAATRRLLTDKDFHVFMGWLQRALGDTKQDLVTCEAEPTLRQWQGQAQALHRICDAVEKTRVVMERKGC